MDSAPNEALLSMDLILLTTTDVSGNETLLSMVDVTAKEALLSTRQHILFALIPNETLLSMDLSPNETLLSMDSASNESYCGAPYLTTHGCTRVQAEKHHTHAG